MIEESRMSVYQFSAALLNGRALSLADFEGQVLLVVNTASKCGFTPQYKGLEEIYREFKDRGFTVLGFPSNQFGGQEPGSETEIGAFCEKNYGVTFPIFAKIDVNGPHAHPLYVFLKRSKPGIFGFLGAGAIPVDQELYEVPDRQEWRRHPPLRSLHQASVSGASN